MKNKKLMLLLTLTCLLSCQQPPDPVKQHPPQPEASSPDLRNFRLPESVNKRAPLMQQHIYKLLPVLTPSFKLKPSFVLAEENDADLSEMVRGQTDVMVTRMNLLHMALFKDGWLTWSGTVLLGVGRGTGLQTRAGYEIMLGIKDQTLNLSFRDGDHILKDSFHYDTNCIREVEQDGYLLYLNYMVIPEEVMKAMGN